MCKTCGCSVGNTQIKFCVKGYDSTNVKEVEKSLLGLPGVYHVHIHVHDGQTTIDYDPVRTALAEITAMLATRGLQAVI
ncbi:Zn-dependent membrane protease YugP [Sporomusaceae bacterium BoRhaA]|uniref:hypothetical protein n=1 Tax=Pelorhabdus rhamnosifermentans TaxID=2772457 RepID=UPI001C0617EB|nr:hypothetical protein [Pelorhabdus rhamnosifermentans]MBU2702367.1 Zn-dependent membrane protease YugP [Pelorhabdus rhamnosifermentans]